VRGKLVCLAAALLALVLVSSGCSYRLHGMTEARGPATDFTLRDQYGAEYVLSEQRGDVVLMFFGYTNCPLECPTTLGDFRRVQAALGEDAAQVQFVLITVDPERDTQEVLHHYMAQFDPSFKALRGEKTVTEHVLHAYGAVGETTHDALSVFHTTNMYLVGPDGTLETVYEYQTDPEIMAGDIEHVLSRS
jgi:protein SCO1/2